MFRRALTLATVAIIVAGMTWALWPKPVQVETEAITKRTIETFVEEEGKTRIREIFTVSAPTTGQLLRPYLHVGDKVVAAQTVIASIRPAEPALLDARSKKIAEANVEAAKAAIDLANAQSRQSQVQQSFMKSELTRSATLVRQGTIANRVYDKAVTDEAAATAEVESSRANLLVRQRQLESAEASLLEGQAAAEPKRCCVEVSAPVSGEVLNVLTESEKVVQVGTPLMELGDPTNLEIVVELLSRDAVRISPGANASIEGWGGSPIKAVVARIDPSAITKISAPGIEEQRVAVVLNLLDSPESWSRLGHGFRVFVRILLWQGENRLAVPMGAIFRSGEEWAVLTAKGNMAHLQIVKLGQRNFDYAEVLDGLELGTKVILHPSDTVRDGTKITASDIAQ